MPTLFNLHGDSSTLQTNIFPPIPVKQNCSIGLIYFMGENLLFNVTEENNTFGVRIVLDNEIFSKGKAAPVIQNKAEYVFNKTLIPGIYEFEHIKTSMTDTLNDIVDKEWNLKEANYSENLIELIKKYFRGYIHNMKFSVNYVTYKWSFDIDRHISLIFYPNSPADLLGIPSQYLPFTFNTTNKGFIAERKKSINLTTITSFNIHCNLVGNSYINGKITHLLYSVPITVSPGYKIFDAPKEIVYLPVNENLIDLIEIKITDQTNKLIDFHETSVTVVLVMINE